MSFSSETIRRKSRSDEEYEKGRALFQTGKVRFLSDESFWKGEENLKVSVEDMGRLYQVTLLIKGSCICRAVCQCPAHREYKGLCRHEAAAAFYAMEKREAESAPRVVTPGAVRQMLHSYVGREMTKVMVSKMEEKVRLVPSFRETAGKLSLSLRIGTGKLYQIRDIGAFAEALGDEAYVEYGKQLGFYHSMDAFEADSARLAEEVDRLAGEYRYLEESADPFRNGKKDVWKEFPLSPGACDSLMKLLQGKTVEFEFPGGAVRTLSIKKENPRLFGVIRAYGRDGFRISLLEEIHVYYGKKRLYLAMGTELYCCDRACSAVLKDFLLAMGQERKNGILEAEIGSREMPSFCDYVLPKISPYVNLEPMGVDLEQYHLAPLAPRFYFDSPAPGEVTLRAEFWYGDTVYTPFDRSLSGDAARDQVGELMVGTVIKTYFPGRYADKSRFAIWDDEEAVYRLLSEGMAEFEACGEVHKSPSMETLKILPKKRLSFGVSLGSDWLELKVDGGELSEEELSEALSAYRKKQRFYRTGSGSFLQLSGMGMGTLDELSRAAGEKQVMKGGFRLPKYRSLYVDKVLKEGKYAETERDEAFRSLVRAVNRTSEAEYSVPDSFRGVLREYQKQGFSWMRTLDSFGFGGILADEMGLGKTIQIIALLADEAAKNPSMETLIVCPASLLYNWESELKRFAGALSVRVIAGTAAERRALLETEKAQIFITSYDLLRRDIALYKDRRFRFQIIDEAQYIKNYGTQNARAVKRIRADGRFALTGTPIENRLSDLWSIFDFLMPGFLYSYPRFKREFEAPVAKDGDKAALKRLHRMAGPFILRRYKKDVLKELPDKLEQVIYSGMEKEQKKLYTAHALLLKTHLESAGDEEYRKERVRFLAELMRLRQICCDPGLCYEDYQGGSAKLETCMELLASGVSAGHKILLFSQFTSMLEIIEERLKKEGIAYYKLTGQTGKEERLEMAGAFNHDPVPVFLISLKAGGTGLNLTAADIVIHYDPWWNLAAEDQATDRAHRIGQKKKVSVFRLIARDTIEEGVLKLQEQKRILEEQITEGALGVFVSRRELLELLKEEP